MSLIGDFSIPAESFALEHALATIPDAAVEGDRLASHSTMEVLPFLWITGGDPDRIHRALADDPTVTERTVADETGEAILYRVQWTDEFCEFINEMVDHHAAIVEAKARGETWHLTLRFAEEEYVSEFQDHFRETGHEFTVNNLTRPAEPRQREFGLTPEQHEALVTAATEGYYRVPRSTTVEELGEKLGISANSASQRLRRGSETLIRNALTVTEE